MQREPTARCDGDAGIGLRSGAHSAHDSYPLYFAPSQLTLLLRPPLEGAALDDPDAINQALERELPDTLEKYFAIETHKQLLAVGDERNSMRRPVVIGGDARGPLVLQTVNLPSWMPWGAYLEHERLALDSEQVESAHRPFVSDVGDALILFERPQEGISTFPKERYRPVGASPNWLAVPFCV